MIANNSQSVASVKQIAELGVLDKLMDKLSNESQSVILDTMNNCTSVKGCEYDKPKLIGKMIEVLEE